MTDPNSSPNPQKKNRIPLILGLVVAGGALAAGGTYYYSRTNAISAYEFYAQKMESYGLKVENGEISYDWFKGSLSVPDFKMSVAGDFEISAETAQMMEEVLQPSTDGAPTTISYKLDMSSPLMTMNGARQEGDTLIVKNWLFADDSKFIAEVSQQGETLVKMDMSQSAFTSENYKVTLPDLPPADPEKPFSRWLAFFKTVSGTSLDSATMEKATATFVVPKDKTTVTMEMKDYEVRDMRDGVIGQYSIGALEQVTETIVENKSPLRQVATNEQIVLKDYNARNLIALLDPSVPESDDVLPLLGSYTVGKSTSNQKIGDAVNIDYSMGSAEYGKISIAKKENDILGLLDRVVNGEKPTVFEIIDPVFSVYRSIVIESASSKDIEFNISTPETNQPIHAALAEMVLKNASADKVEEISVSGVKVAGMEDGSAFSMDKLRLFDLDFAPYAPMREVLGKLINAAENENEEADIEPLAIARAFVPRSVAYEIAGLDLKSPDANFKLEKLEEHYATAVAPIPTSYTSEMKNLVIPAELIEDETARELLESLGIQTLKGSSAIKLDWNKDTKDLTLHNLEFDIEKMGKLTATITIGDVPQSVFENPEEAETAWIGTTFKGANLVFKDAGMAAGLIANTADENGLTPEQMVEILNMQLAEAVQQIGSEAFAQMVTTAGSQFLGNPGTLKVTLAPEQPVAMAQIMGGMMMPQMLPDLLSVKVEASN